MQRFFAIFNMSVLVALAACAGPTDDTSGALYGAADVAPRGALALTPAARQVSQIAAQNGDRNFLILDKSHGRIIAFENGVPTFSGAALTGENPADFLEPGVFSLPFSAQKGFRYKITPAGRYTVSVGYDNAYGDTLDVNEIQGVDWDISIHKVWLGAPQEHRDTRLRSASDQDKHITYGCIDVDGPTMQGLLDRVPNEEHTPLYILPSDDRLIQKVFQPRDAARMPSAPAG